MSCIFCDIVSRKIPADIVAETENLLAFRDINPQAPLHILIIPKKHYPRLGEELDSAENKTILGEIQILADRIARKFGLTGGYRLVLNCGPDAGQAVAHIHYHLLGGRQFRWPPG